MKPAQKFFVEFTDTFGGEANYSWVTRFMVTATSPMGAIRKVTRLTGCPARKAYDSGDTSRYNVSGACLCYFVSYSDGAEEENYPNIEII
jgi:hypothetical protein